MSLNSPCCTFVPLLFAFVPEKLETSLTCLFDTLPWPYKKLIVEDQVAGKGLMPPKARAKGGAATSAPPKQFISDNPKSKGSKGWSKRRQRAGPAPTAEEAAQSAAKEAACEVFAAAARAVKAGVEEYKEMEEEANEEMKLRRLVRRKVGGT